MKEGNTTEMKLVCSKDEFEIICHADGLVEIAAGDRHLLQISRDEFGKILERRSILMLGH